MRDILLCSASNATNMDISKKYAIFILREFCQMKKYISILFAILFYACQQQDKPLEPEVVPKTPLVLKDRKLLESGDIILKQGYGPVSTLVTKFLQEDIPISHCGVIVMQDTTAYVVHSISKEFAEIDGVQLSVLDTFLLDCNKNSVFIVRNKFNKIKRNLFSDKAVEYSKRVIPFDYEFNYQEKNKMYCSELIYCLFLEVYEKDFFEKKEVNNTSLLKFSSLFDTTNFILVLHE